MLPSTMSAGRMSWWMVGSSRAWAVAAAEMTSFRKRRAELEGAVSVGRKGAGGQVTQSCPTARREPYPVLCTWPGPAVSVACGRTLLSQGGSRAPSRLSSCHGGRKSCKRGDVLVLVPAGVEAWFLGASKELFCRPCYQKSLACLKMGALHLTPAFICPGTWNESLNPLDLFPPYEIGITSPFLLDSTVVESCTRMCSENREMEKKASVYEIINVGQTSD